MTKILLVEDDINFGSVLKEYLKLKDFDIDLAKDGAEGYNRFRSGIYNLIILDVMMPHKDGFTLAEEIRQHDQETPIIFLTARNMKKDIVRGYHVGAEDYLTKPFDTEVLLLKIQAILKRTAKGKLETDQSIFNLGATHFNAELRMLKTKNKEHRLSPKENALLKLLCQHSNTVLKREKALKSIWKEANYFTARSMDVYITKLRKLLKEEPKVSIVNLHGDGFRLVVRDT
jgi:DNA-binding response OmpR family regulator